MATVDPAARRFTFEAHGATFTVSAVGGDLRLTHYALTEAGVYGDLETLVDAFWQMAPDAGVIAIELWWRAGDPYEVDVLRKR